MSSTTRALRCCAAGVMGAVIGLGACEAPDLAQPGSSADRTAAQVPPTSPSDTPTATPATTAAATPSRTPARLPELPRGGRTLFPHFRLVGYAGAPGSAALGRLGVGDLDDRVRELEKRAGAFASGRKPQPVLELLTTIVQGSAGRDGKWRSRLSDKVIREHLDAARRHRAILLLGIQPGRATFLDEVKAYEKWLRATGRRPGPRPGVGDEAGPGPDARLRPNDRA